jgi:hypothetical protein
MEVGHDTFDSRSHVELPLRDDLVRLRQSVPDQLIIDFRFFLDLRSDLAEPTRKPKGDDLGAFGPIALPQRVALTFQLNGRFNLLLRGGYLPAGYDHRGHDGAEACREREKASDAGLPVIEQVKPRREMTGGDIGRPSTR